MPATWPPSPPANSRNQQPKREPRMMIFNNGRKAQGGALPATARHGTIHPAGGLDTHLHGWRIRHPQAVTRHRKICNHFPIPGNLPGIYLYLGAWVGSQRKRPHCAVPMSGTVLRLPDPPCRIQTRNHPMIYTFCVTRSRGPIAALPAIRTVSVYATNEAQARTRLAGLPLVFLSRCPAREVAA